jgi:carbohydrate-selective porin OprB
LYELWLQQELLGGKLRVKLGKVDANSEFAAVENAGGFLNSSMGYSPTILAFPTYPAARPSLNLFWQPRQRYSIAFGLYDTTGPGAMTLLEAGRRWSLGPRELPGRTSFGVWRLSGTVPCFDGTNDSGAKGFYLVTEQALWRPAQPAAGREPSLAAFLQFGWARNEISPLTRHLGSGLVWRSPFASRPRDALGLGATWVRFSSEPSAGFEYNYELTLEAYYQIQLTRFFTLVPDLQFIHLPGGLRCQPDSVVFTPRLAISF